MWEVTACPGIPADPLLLPASRHEAARPDRLLLALTQSRPRGRVQLRPEGPRLSLRRLASMRVAIQPGLRRREARETWNRRGEIDRLPFRIEARPLQLVEPREQMLDKA